MDRHLLTEKTALGILLGWLEVTDADIHALYDHPILVRNHPKHLADRAAVIARGHDDRITLSYVPGHSQITSDASDTIFM